jgi:hypothetical protein
MIAPELFKPHPHLRAKRTLPLLNKWCVPSCVAAIRRGTRRKRLFCWNQGLSFTVGFGHAVSNPRDERLESKRTDPAEAIQIGEPKKTNAAIVVHYAGREIGIVARGRRTITHFLTHLNPRIGTIII